MFIKSMQMDEINRQAFYSLQRSSLCQKCKCSTLPSVDDTTQQVEETRLSSGASSNENGGLWNMLKQLKEQILASGRRMGPVILNVFNKVIKTIWQGCVSVCGIIVSRLCLLFVCTVFVAFVSFLCLLILSLVLLFICAIVFGRLTGVNLVSYKFTRRADHFSFSIKKP